MNKKGFVNLLVIGLIVGLCIFLFTSSQYNTTTFLYTMGISLMYTVIMGAGNGVINHYLNKKYSWTENTNQRTWLGILSAIIVNVVLVYLCNYINFIIIQGEPSENFWNGSMNFRNWFFINLAFLITAILHARGFMEAWKNTAKKEIVEQKIIAKSANAQFESLKNQLDPHFLFNSLNVLDALIEENPTQAQKFTNDMSKIYRYVLDQKDKELVSIQEEIDFAKTYAELLKTRFEDSVIFEFDITENSLQHYVVPLSLQLLLENAIKHNYATSKKPLKISINSNDDFLIVKNNLQQREMVKDREGIGLSNIVQRYALLTNRNLFIEKSEEIFVVKIPKLLEKKSEIMDKMNITNEALAYDRAVKRVKELKGFYGNLISFCLVIPTLIFINFKTSPQYLWFWWPMLGWGIGLASHAFQTFGIGKNWEEKKIRQLMENEKNRL